MRPVLACLLLVSMPLSAQRVPEIEPNNTPASAQMVVMGRQVDASLATLDNDWYRFTTLGGEVRMTTSGIVDTRIVLWDSAGIICQGGNDDCRGIQSDITLNLAAGTYTLQVTGFTPSTTGPYSLDIADESTAKAFTAVEAEPNDLLAQAQLLALSAQVDGNMSSATDIDIYQVVLTAPRTGIFLQINEGNAPWVSQHRFEIWDAAGAPVPAASLGVNAGDSGQFTFRTAMTRCWPAGTYHIVVRSRTAAQTFNPLPLGNYRLEILAMPMSTGAMVAENAEPNHTVATATPFLPGQQGLGNVSTTGGDVTDLWGPIAITTPSVLQVQTGNGAGTAILDTTIRLLQQDPQDPNTLLLAANITLGNILEGAAGLHARGTFTFFVPGLNYYVAVDSPGTDASQTGNYVLELSSLESAPYVTSSYSIVPANATCGVFPFPILTRTFQNETPTIGQTFSRQVNGLQLFGLGLLIQGTDNIAPIDVSPFTGSAPMTCFLNVNLLNVLPVTGDLFGRAELSLNIPASVSLRSATLWEQILKWDSFAVLNVQMGNYARILVGDRSY